MKSKRIKLIQNPGAGDTGSSTARLEQVTRKLLDLGFKVDVALAHPKEKTIPIARKAARNGYSLVVVMGGDGTIEAVASALVGSKTRLGILPTGTYNNIAKSMGIPEDLDAACDVLMNGKKQRIDVGQVWVNGKKSYFFEQVASGLSAALFPEVKDVHTLPPVKLARAVRTFFNFQMPHYRLVLDKESRIEADTLLVTIANMPAYGATFLEAPEAALDDGMLEIRLYPGFNRAELAAYFASIMNGQTSNDERVQRYRARRIQLTSNPKQPAVADNRILGKGKVKVRVLRKALRVMAPVEGSGLAQETPPVAEQIPAPVSPIESKNDTQTPIEPAVEIPVQQ